MEELTKDVLLVLGGLTCVVAFIVMTVWAMNTLGTAIIYASNHTYQQSDFSYIKYNSSVTTILNNHSYSGYTEYYSVFMGQPGYRDIILMHGDPDLWLVTERYATMNGGGTYESFLSFDTLNVSDYLGTDYPIVEKQLTVPPWIPNITYMSGE